MELKWIRRVALSACAALSVAWMAPSVAATSPTRVARVTLDDGSVMTFVDSGHGWTLVPPGVTVLPSVTVTASPIDNPPSEIAWSGVTVSTIPITTSSGPERGSGSGSDGEAKQPSQPVAPNRTDTDCKRKTERPVLIDSGLKIKPQTDFQTRHLYPLSLKRMYNEGNAGRGIFGVAWASNFDPTLSFKLTSGTFCAAVPGQTTTCVPATGNVATVTANRSDGSAYTYNWNATTSRYESASLESDEWIVRNADGSWTFQAKGGTAENYNLAGFITSAKDPTGIGWTYSYTSNYLQLATHTSGKTVQFGWQNGQLTSVTDPSGGLWTYSYNANGYLSGETMPNGNKRTYSYTDASHPWALTSVLGDSDIYGSSASYYPDGRVYQSSGDGGYDQSTFVYTANTTQVTNGLGAVATYTYATVNGVRKLIQVDQSGVTGCPSSTRSIAYDANGHIQTETDQRGIQTQYVYSATGQLLQKTTGIDSNNPGQQRTVQYVWDNTKDRMTEAKTFGASTSAPIADVVYTYYADASPAKNRLASVAVTNLTQNGALNQTQTTTYTYQFYASGMPSSIVVDGPSGHVTQNYDSAGNLTGTVDALNNTATLNGFNGLGIPASVTDANGYTLSYTYDAIGQTKTVSRTVDGVAGTTTYTLSGRDITKVTYADGGSLSMAYWGAHLVGSLQNNIVKNEYINGTSYQTTAYETFERNALGGVTLAWMRTHSDPYPSTQTCGGIHTDSVGLGGLKTASSTQPGPCPALSTDIYKHTWTYDTLGRVLTDNGDHGQSLTYAYDPDGNVQSVTDALNHKTTYTYNAHNQLQTVTNPLMQVTSYTYDGSGYLASVTDPKNNVTSYTYDGFGNVASISSPDSGLTSFAYDALGRKTRMTRNDGSQTLYYYDALNRPTQILAGSQSQTFAYDTCTNGKGRLCTITDASGTTSYTYRLNGQIASQNATINGTSYLTSWAYDNRDRATRITYPGGNYVSYQYDGQSNVTQVTASVGGTTTTVAGDFSYLGLGMGPLSSMSLGASSSVSQTYDTDLRLTKLQGSPVQTLRYGYYADNTLNVIYNDLNSAATQYFGYDALSRLNTVNSTALGNQGWTFDNNSNRVTHTKGSATDTYSPDASSNRITSLSGAVNKSFGYDTLGNLNSETVGGTPFTYGYDSLNRLTSFTSSGATTSYAYNAFNQRVRKTGPGGNYSYVYAGGTLLGETSNNGTTLTTQYLWLGGQPIAMIRNGSFYYIHNDHLGRPQVVTDGANVIVWSANTLAYDRSIVTDTIGGLNIGFPGQYFDAESGLYYNMNRYYDASLGGFIQTDPAGLLGGLNTYAYAGRNPISFVDPWGLCSKDGYLNNLANNFTATNDSWQGKVSQFASANGAVLFAGQATQTPAPIQWALNGLGSVRMGAASFTPFFTGVAVAGNWAMGASMGVGAFQFGNLVGSAITAIPVGDGRTVGDVLSGMDSCSCRN